MDLNRSGPERGAAADSGSEPVLGPESCAVSAAE